MEKDMTKGSPLPVILQFTLPLIIGNIFQQLYNMADTIIVGRYVGADALAAVGSTGTIMFLVCAGHHSRLYGSDIATVRCKGYARSKAKCGKRHSTGSPFHSCPDILQHDLHAAIAASHEHTGKYFSGRLYLYYDYLRWPDRYDFLQSAFLLSACSRKQPDSADVPDFFGCIKCSSGSASHHSLGVAGAGYATVFSQGISAVLCLFYIYRSMPDMWPEKHHWKLHAADSRHQLSMGIPMALQFAITASGTMIMQAAINLFGSEAVAAFTAACKLQNLVTQGFSAMGQTMATYSGQNFGKGDIPRIKKGVRAALLTSITYSIAAAVLVFLLLKPCLSLFFSGDVDMAAMMPWAKTYSYMCALFYVPLCTIFIFRNAMQGCGYGFLPMMGGVSELFARLIVAVIAIKVISYPLACFCDPAAWVTAAVFTGVSYLFVMKDIDKKYDSKTSTAPIS